MARNWRNSLERAVGPDTARTTTAQLAYLAGLRDAAAIVCDGRNIKFTQRWESGWDNGHADHRFAIRDFARRVKREMKDA